MLGISGLEEYLSILSTLGNKILLHPVLCWEIYHLRIFMYLPIDQIFTRHKVPNISLNP